MSFVLSTQWHEGVPKNWSGYGHMVYFAVNNARNSKSTEIHHDIKPSCIIFSFLHTLKNRHPAVVRGLSGLTYPIGPCEMSACCKIWAFSCVFVCACISVFGFDYMRRGEEMVSWRNTVLQHRKKLVRRKIGSIHKKKRIQKSKQEREVRSFASAKVPQWAVSVPLPNVAALVCELVLVLTGMFIQLGSPYSSLMQCGARLWAQSKGQSQSKRQLPHKVSISF